MDLIDRQALTERKFPEVECNNLGEGPAYRQGWNDAIDAIIDNELSAQPNASNTLESLDCIDRQAAIDALRRKAWVVIRTA